MPAFCWQLAKGETVHGGVSSSEFFFFPMWHHSVVQPEFVAWWRGPNTEYTNGPNPNVQMPIDLACMVLANVSLAKASHRAQPRANVERHWPRP